MGGEPRRSDRLKAAKGFGISFEIRDRAHVLFGGGSVLFVVCSSLFIIYAIYTVDRLEVKHVEDEYDV